jgi:amino acid adenylation domain-containing protein
MSADSWFDAVAAVATRSPAKVALRDGDILLTYDDLVTKAGKLARWLQEQGIRPGDRVGVHLRKGTEEILLTLASVRLGACFVHVHPQLTVAQLRHIILDSGMRVLITQGRRARELESDPALAQQLDALVVVGDRPTDRQLGWPVLDEVKDLSLPLPDGGRIATLLYTSGSTGAPKGVMHSQRNLLQFAANVAQYLEVREMDRVMGLLPISFGYGLNQVLTTLYAGGTLVLQKTSFPAEVVKTLVNREITGLAAVPSVWAQLLTYLDEQPTSLPALRYITNAGGHLSEKNALRLRGHLPRTNIVLMYGSTESLRTTYLPPDQFTAKTGAIGTAIPSVETFVVNAAGRLCGVGEVGELVHRGAHVSQGYWNKAGETAQRFKSVPALREQYGDEVMYWTGDLVKRDADGVLWFVSRSDWMVKSGGFRYSLSEVEEVLLQSGLVAQAAAFAVADESLGQVVHAVVTRRGTSRLQPEALHRYCRKAMPAYMIPRAFYTWQGSFPLLANGKLDRVALMDAALGATSRPATLTGPV